MVVDMVVPSVLPAFMQSPINCGSIAMLAGLILVPVVSLLTPKPEEKLMEEIFSCYEKTNVVEQKTALGK